MMSVGIRPTVLLVLLILAGEAPTSLSFGTINLRPSNRSTRSHQQTIQQHSRSALAADGGADAAVGTAIEWTTRLARESQAILACASTALSPFGGSKASTISAEGIVEICDQLDEARREAERSSQPSDDEQLSPKVPWVFQSPLQLKVRALELQRYESLVQLMQKNYSAYVATASFLSPSRIPRRQLPNLQDVPVDETTAMRPTSTAVTSSSALSSSSSSSAAVAASTVSPALMDKTTGRPLVADCELEAMQYQDSLLDKALLSIFRKLVAHNTGGITSDTKGIEGLLEQGRTFLLQKGQTPEAQHKMVYDTLGGLMTPVLPPFYRIFMSGIVPKSIGGDQWGGKRLGPWFYAPFLTSFVTPTFFGFLVGPSYPNRRKDGQLGGLVVEKCKFLQESGCKGLCLHQCKLPAQQYFAEELGLALTVSPNFVTQECQWSFGEVPLPPDQDPSFPKGCLVGCESRKAIAASGLTADICN